MRRLSLLAVLVALVAAAPAHAGGTLFDGGVRPIGEPAFAGERVVWATQSGSSASVHLAATDGSGRSTRVVRLPRTLGEGDVFGIDASPGRLVLGYGTRHCRPRCREGDFRIANPATLSAPLGEQPLRLEADCAPVPGVGPRFGVSGNVVAYRDSCAKRTVVLDFATGERFEYPAADVVRVGGAYLATLEGGAVVLREWRTGIVHARFEGAAGPVDIQDDGKAVFRRERGFSDEFVWISPEDPEPHVVAASNHIGQRIAGDRVAFLTSSGGLEVRDLAGRLVATSEDARPGDFDGRRVVWAQRPCAVAGIATWDLEGEPPLMPEGGCPSPSLRSRVLRADLERKRVTVKLACPAESPLGCRGYLRLVVPESYRGPDERPILVAQRGWALRPAYVLLPGERQAVELKLSSKGTCAAGRKALRPVLDVWTQGRNDLGDLRSSWRVRVPGLGPAVARCARQARGA